MKRISLAAALALAASSSFAGDVAVSVSIGQPGFYGRIDIGGYPAPALVYAEPVIVQVPRASVAPVRPLYLHVPPGHAKDWRKHCGKYGACGQPVYFVQENWYNDVYVRSYREREPSRGHGGEPPGKGNGHGKGKGKH